MLEIAFWVCHQKTFTDSMWPCASSMTCCTQREMPSAWRWQKVCIKQIYRSMVRVRPMDMMPFSMHHSWPDYWIRLLLLHEGGQNSIVFIFWYMLYQVSLKLRLMFLSSGFRSVSHLLYFPMPPMVKLSIIYHWHHAHIFTNIHFSPI
jgi:hypothetical protein